MDWIQIIGLALIQGLTEFLPISSSGHLILPSQVLGWPDQGLAFDVAVHVGSLAAVLIYFRKDVWQLAYHWTAQVVRAEHDRQQSQLAWLVILATLPAVVIGYALNEWVETHFRSALVIALATIGFGALLWWSDATAKLTQNEFQLNWKTALFIGFGQVFALIPGTSRSGITMTVGLMVGLTRKASARFSFLLSIPLILAAGLFKGLELYKMGMDAPWGDVIAGAVLSAISAYACIHLFLNVIERIGFLPFVIYRFILGGILLAIIFA